MSFDWHLPFLEPAADSDRERKQALVILNQPFSYLLLHKLWTTSDWRCCADGGANRLHDLLAKQITGEAKTFIPDLIKGDLDSLRDDVRAYYEMQNVEVVQDHDQDSTDLMKCVQTIEEREKKLGCRYEIVILGGLTGRLDQTIHTLSYLYKLRKTRERVFTVTDDNVAWILDSGEHRIRINHTYLGKTCGLLPVGIDSTILTTRGLRWNLTERESCFDGMVSTSNHLVPEEQVVYVKTTKPIFWTVELQVDKLE